MRRITKKSKCIFDTFRSEKLSAQTRTTRLFFSSCMESAGKKGTPNYFYEMVTQE